MEPRTTSLVIEPERVNHAAIDFCQKFLRGGVPRYVFGCNSWARSIAEKVDIDGFVDDIFPEKLFFDKPVIRSNELPTGAFVVSAIVGERPLLAMRRINQICPAALDYYAFQKYSDLVLDEVMFLGEFQHDFKVNRNRYEWLFERLEDAESRRVLSRLINFRLSRDLLFMDGFVDAQDRQYFEPFLELQETNESFLDVGCYDGFTSLEFIKRCPGYRSIHVFEPESGNMGKVKSRLAEYPNIYFHPYGVSDKEQTLRFKSAGSASVVSNDGELSIKVKRIDDVIHDSFGFLKMDIEGGEILALRGASKTIGEYQPRLAICVYHKVDDLRKIPELVLKIRDDYRIFLRHYTEGVTETVMFFMPPAIK